ncbi:MAG TPA: hypothetical protein VK169_11010 [Saprospiraceae bacterium]|nr:hypothetical protein [Saprospiraceae bacterium]
MNIIRAMNQFQWAIARRITFTLVFWNSSCTKEFQWAIARRITFTHRWMATVYDLDVSVGYRPKDHFHKIWRR